MHSHAKKGGAMYNYGLDPEDIYERTHVHRMERKFRNHKLGMTVGISRMQRVRNLVKAKHLSLKRRTHEQQRHA